MKLMDERSQLRRRTFRQRRVEQLTRSARLPRGVRHLGRPERSSRLREARRRCPRAVPARPRAGGLPREHRPARKSSHCGFPQCNGTARSLRSIEVQPARGESPVSSARALTRRVLPALLLCVVFVPAALAATTDRVQVGQRGAERDRGLPAGPLHVGDAAARLPGARPLRRRVPQLGRAELQRRQPRRQVDARLAGHVRAGGSAAAAAAKARSERWPVAERPRVRIPHRVGRRNVGSIPAVALLTKAPGDNNAQYESVLAFPLCRGLFATAKFSLLSPVAEYASRPGRPLPRSRASRRSSGTTTGRSRRSARSRSRAICLRAG